MERLLWAAWSSRIDRRAVEMVAVLVNAKCALAARRQFILSSVGKLAFHDLVVGQSVASDA